MCECPHRAIRALFAVLLVPLVSACDSPSVQTGSISHLPFQQAPFDILVDDFDADGRADIALTSHHLNFTQLYHQTRARQFKPGPLIEEVGFHPGRLIRLPGDDRRLYIMHAEGDNRLRVMAPNDRGGLDVVAESPADSPRVGTTFQWPGWGLGLAAIPFRRSAVLLLKDFDPTTASSAEAITVEFTPSFSLIEEMITADMDGDDIAEVVFPNSVTNEISVVRFPRQGGQAEVEQLWQFEPAGRSRIVVAADLNQDGHNDLLVPDQMEKGPLATSSAAHPSDGLTAINVLLNDGSGEFELREIPYLEGAQVDGRSTRVHSFAFAPGRDGYGYAIASGSRHLSLLRFPPRWSGNVGEVQQRSIAHPTVDAMSRLALHDLDGDGSLDAVVGRPDIEYGALVLYGPLWENFAEWTSADLLPPGAELKGDDARD